MAYNETNEECNKRLVPRYHFKTRSCSIRKANISYAALHLISRYVKSITFCHVLYLVCFHSDVLIRSRNLSFCKR